MTTQDLDVYTFFSNDTNTGEHKLFAEGGSKGYVAHIDGTLAFVKAWTDIPPEQRAPGEAEIEMYTDPSGTYVEIEDQGPYATVAAGARAEWQVRWSVSTLASSVSPSASVADTATRQTLEQTADNMAQP